MKSENILDQSTWSLKKLELINALQYRVFALYDSLNVILHRVLTGDTTTKIRFVCCADNILQSSQILNLINCLREYYSPSHKFAVIEMLHKNFRKLVSTEDPTNDDQFEVVQGKIFPYVDDKVRLLTVFNTEIEQNFTFNHSIVDFPDLESLSERRKGDFGRFSATLNI